MSFVLAMSALGLVTSVHCVSMCGPMIISYAVKGDAQGSWPRRLMPHLAYHGARFSSYALVGLFMGAVGSVFNFDLIRPYVMFAAGGLMVVLGLGMTGRVPWAQRLMPAPPKFLVTALRKTLRRAKTDAEAGEESLATPITFGLLTGLLPCGPLLGAELAAAGTGSPVMGAVGMLAFAIGTSPLLLAFGTGASLLPKRFKARMNLGLAVVLMLFGLVFFNRALMLVGSPVTFATAKQVVLGSSDAASQPDSPWTTASDGVVEVPIAYVDMKMVPRNVRIPANTPVRLIFDRRKKNATAEEKRQACKSTSQVTIPQLDILQELAPSTTTPIDIPPTSVGTYAVTCGMGVLEGSLVVVEAPATH